MAKKPAVMTNPGKPQMVKAKKGWMPMEGPALETTEVKNKGVKIRGTGAATKGTMARGPMA